MVLLRRRDCAGGTGPAVDAPSVDVLGPVVARAVVLAGAAAAVAGAWEVEEEVEWRPWNKPGAG